MKAMKLFVLVIVFSQTLFVPTAKAYEGIFHYAWTYYLALQVGFTERQAYQIASGTNALDWDGETNPIASPLDSKVDTAFGAERFRYLDEKLNQLWGELDHNLWKNNSKEPGLIEKDQDATLLSLRKVQAMYPPANMLGKAWQKYYDALIERNPAVRTWVQLHAFQPIVLQKHKNRSSDFHTNFSTGHSDLLSLDSPLASFQQNDLGWILTNSRLTWGLASQLTTPAKGKNGNFSKLDANSYDLIMETINYCQKESMKACLCENPNKLAKNLASIQTNYSSELDVPLIEERDYLPCEGKPSIDATDQFFQKISTVLDAIIKISLKKNDRRVQDQIHKWTLETRIYDKISSLPFLAHIQIFQKETGMAWPLIFSALMRDIEIYLLNEYWDPQEPIKLGISHAPTKAVNAVRGESVRQLWELAKHDRNPGPLLHFIQDLHSHGAYNTFHGHATANHVPDFIDQDRFNAINATVDTIIVLCEFKNELRESSVDWGNTTYSDKVFVGQRIVESELCKNVQPNTDSALRSLISQHSLSNGPEDNVSLKDILTLLGKQSKVPSVRSSKVTWQGLQKLLQRPPHSIEESQVTGWTNEMIGLPDFPRAVRFLSTQVRANLIPVWRSYDLRLEERKEDLSRIIDQHFDGGQPELEAEIDAWKPIGIPTSVIQFDYDYCGRVYKADRSQKTGKGLPSWSKKVNNLASIESKAIPCHVVAGGNPRSNPRTNTLYMVEDVGIQITNMSIGRSSDQSSYSWKLEYNVFRMVPGLNGNFPIQMTKPKSLTMPLDARHSKNHENWKEASTDMYTIESKVEFGPNALPVYEHCQLLVPRENDVHANLDAILHGAFEGQIHGESGTATQQILDYLDDKMIWRGDLQSSGLVAGLLASNVRRITHNEKLEEVKMSSKGVTKPMGIEAYIEEGSPAYMVCSVQVQGLPPVVAMRKASLSFAAQVKGVKQGRTSSE